MTSYKKSMPSLPGLVQLGCSILICLMPTQVKAEVGNTDACLLDTGVSICAQDLMLDREASGLGFDVDQSPLPIFNGLPPAPAPYSDTDLTAASAAVNDSLGLTPSAACNQADRLTLLCQ